MTVSCDIYRANYPWSVVGVRDNKQEKLRGLKVWGTTMVSASGQNLRVKARTPRKEATREFPLYGTEIFNWVLFVLPI